MSAKKRKTVVRRNVYDKTIDLHRHTLEEAIDKIDLLINTGQYNNILVIHGYGQGILKNGLRKHFANHRLVREYCSGEEVLAAGGDGVTVVYM